LYSLKLEFFGKINKRLKILDIQLEGILKKENIFSWGAGECTPLYLFLYSFFPGLKIILICSFSVIFE